MARSARHSDAGATQLTRSILGLSTALGVAADVWMSRGIKLEWLHDARMWRCVVGPYEETNETASRAVELAAQQARNDMMEERAGELD